MNRWIPGLVAIALLVTVAPTHALTVDDVIGLTRAEANDAIIMAKIEADATVFQLTVDDILLLKESGVSDAVITYMINTGKVSPAGEAYAEDPAEELQEEVADQGHADDDYYDDGYYTEQDQRYRGSISVSFGSYYPQWPGYWYAYYYDPFWWPSQRYYWAYCPPFPYYRYAYSSIWWNSWWCGYTYYHYDNHHHYDYHHYGTYKNYDNTHYARVLKDRNVGTRVTKRPGERVYKNPNDRVTARPTRVGRGEQLRTPTPGTNRPTRVDNRGKVRSPRNPETPTRVTDSRPERGKVRPTPARQPAKRVGTPSRRGPRKVNSGPARVQRSNRPAPTPAPRVRSNGNQTKPPPQAKETKDTSGNSRNNVRSGKTRSAPSRSSKAGGNRSGKRSSRSGKP